MRFLIVLAALVTLLSCGASADYARPEYAQPGEEIYATSRGEVMEAEADSGGFFKERSKKQAAGPSGGTASPAAAPAQDVGIDQKLVKNAYLTIVLKDEKFFDPAVKQAEQIAKKLDGYVASTTRNSISFKVPTGKLDEALASVSELGKVKHRDVTTVDVTASYVDLAIRIENLAKVQERLRELVKQGKTVEEILHVERELARVTSQLEALQGQMRVMDNQTTFATVTVTFQERVRPGPLGWVFYGIYRGVKWLFVWD